LITLSVTLLPAQARIPSPDKQLYAVCEKSQEIGRGEERERISVFSSEGKLVSVLHVWLTEPEGTDRVGIRGPRDLLAHHWIGGAELRAALSPGPLNTDDNMLIEFTAPLRVLARRPGDQMAQATELAGMFAGQTSGILPHLTPPGAGRPALSRFWAQMSGSTLAGGFGCLAGCVCSLLGILGNLLDR